MYMKKISALLMSLITCNLALAHNEEAIIGAFGIVLLIHIIIVFVDYRFNGKNVGNSILLFLLFFVGLYGFIEFVDGNYISEELQEKYFLVIAITFFFIVPITIKTFIIKMYQIRKKSKIKLINIVEK